MPTHLIATSLVAATFLATGLVSAFGTAATSPDDEDAAVRAILDSYLGTLTCTDPKPVDDVIFGTEIEAFWSNGEAYVGRRAVAKAMDAGVAQIAANFDSFSSVAEDVTIRREGNLAWLTCRIESLGELNRERGRSAQKVRSTFIFEKRDSTWAMVHEHSSQVGSGK